MIVQMVCQKADFVELSQRLLREWLVEKGEVSVIILDDEEGPNAQLQQFKAYGLNTVYRYQFGGQYLFTLLA